MGVEQLRSPSTQAAMPATGQAVVNAVEASLVIVAMEQMSVSAPSTPPTTGGAAPEEVGKTKVSASLRANAGSSQALVHAGDDLHASGGPALWWADQQNPGVTLFTLDDVMEVEDWERIDMGVELVARALNMALGALHDVVDLIGWI
jgi:hypothetical protein